MACACLKPGGAAGEVGAVITALKPFHITRALQLWSRTPGILLSEADEPEALASFLVRNPRLSFVALDEHRVVATVLCGHDGRRGMIYHLAVAGSHKRRGLGRLLVKRALAALHAEGIDKCYLLVLDANQEGIAFWQSVGAEERVELTLFSLPTPWGRDS